MLWTASGSNPGRDEILRTSTERVRGYPASWTMDAGQCWLVEFYYNKKMQIFKFYDKNFHNKTQQLVLI
jgi:hypothetical protein